jgi:hypothetical protein
MNVNSMTIPCPFCGVSNNAPHETQEACIAALQNEIARIRAMAERVRPFQDGPEQPRTDLRERADPD